MDLRQFRLELTGSTPMMQNNPVSIGINKGRDPAAWEREHIQDMLYTNDAGVIVVTAAGIRKSAIVATKFLTDKPKARQFKSYGPLVEAALIIEADAALNVDVDKIVGHPLIVNLDPSKGPRGPRGTRVRPLIPLPWRCETNVMVADDALTTAALDAIFEAAGRLVGVHDGRAIGYGRFRSKLTALKG